MGNLRTSSVRDLIIALSNVEDSLRATRGVEVSTEELTQLVRAEQAIVRELRRRRSKLALRPRPVASLSAFPR